MEKEKYLQLIKNAYKEDLDNNGDVTSDAIFTDSQAHAVLYSKDHGVLAGLEVFKDCFLELDPSVQFQEFFKEGDFLKPGDKVIQVSGMVRTLLCGERTSLNFIALLSGIASRTYDYVSCLKPGSKVKILDTRKTIPGFRYLSKYAVKVGNGTNHRMGLYDMVLIKDNHIDAAGSVTNAVSMVKKRWNNRFKIEVECRTLNEVREALSQDIDIIMLDNMNLEQIKEAVQVTANRVKLEVSGNITKERIKELDEAGIDYISIGSLTKSVNAFDFSLKILK